MPRRPAEARRDRAAPRPCRARAAGRRRERGGIDPPRRRIPPPACPAHRQPRADPLRDRSGLALLADPRHVWPPALHRLRRVGAYRDRGRADRGRRRAGFATDGPPRRLGRQPRSAPGESRSATFAMCWRPMRRGSRACEHDRHSRRRHWDGGLRLPRALRARALQADDRHHCPAAHRPGDDGGCRGPRQRRPLQLLQLPLRRSADPGARRREPPGHVVQGHRAQHPADRGVHRQHRLARHRRGDACLRGRLSAGRPTNSARPG